MIQTTGTLPVAIPMVIEGKAVKANNIVMRQVTVAQVLAAQGSLKKDDYVVVGELASMTSAVIGGVEYAVSYEALATSSRQNLDYLLGLRAELDAKEQAESQG